MDAANQPQNKKKNRYENIKPFDDNRVKLSKLVNSDGSDYINASYVDTYAHKKAFIATQAPLVETLSDFWRMIYENESWVIVMLGQEIENGQVMFWFCIQLVTISERKKLNFEKVFRSFLIFLRFGVYI